MTTCGERWGAITCDLEAGHPGWHQGRVDGVTRGWAREEAVPEWIRRQRRGELRAKELVR